MAFGTHCLNIHSFKIKMIKYENREELLDNIKVLLPQLNAMLSKSK